MRILSLFLFASAALFSQLDLSFLPSYEHRVYKRVSARGTEMSHTYLYRTNDVVRVYYTNGNDANVYSFTTTGKPLEHKKYEGGKLIETVIYDWSAMKIRFNGMAEGKPLEQVLDLRPNTVCAYMASEVFRGYPLGRELSADFFVFSVEKGRVYFDAVLRVAKRNVPVKTASGDHAANIVKLSAGFAFIKIEQKYDFYYDAGGSRALVYYDGVDGTDKKLTASLELYQKK